MQQYNQNKQSLLTIGNLIKNGCARCGITLQQLAMAVRLTEPTLNSIVSGTARTTEHAARILGFLLKTYRMANNMSAEDLSAKVGVVPSAINELERGTSLDVSRFRQCFHSIDGVTLFVPESESPKDVQKAVPEKQAKPQKKQKRIENARKTDKERMRQEPDKHVAMMLGAMITEGQAALMRRTMKLAEHEALMRRAMIKKEQAALMRRTMIPEEHEALMRRAMLFAKRGDVNWRDSQNMPFLFRACRERIKKNVKEVSEAIGYPVKAIEDVENGGCVDFEMLEALLKYIGTLSVHISKITKTSKEVARIKSNIAVYEQEQEQETKVMYGDATPVRRNKELDSQITRKEWGAAARPATIGR